MTEYNQTHTSTRSGVVCSGVSSVDLFLYDTDPLPTRESLSLVGRTGYRAGGAASNTGRALARLGMPVTLLTAIGTDARGEQLLRLWAEDGLDTRCVTRLKGGETGFSVLPVYRDGKRGVYNCPGVNALMDTATLLGPGSVGRAALAEAQAFYFAYPPLAQRLQGEALADLLRIARDAGTLVALDTTPIADDTSLAHMLAPALPYAHLFTPNIMEAAQVAGCYITLAERAVARASRPCAIPATALDIEDIITREEVIAIGEAILAMGVPIVAITLGPNGAFLLTGDEKAMGRVPMLGAQAACPDLTGSRLPGDDAKAGGTPALHGWANARVYAPAYAVNGPVNTTGAGDAFTAALIAGLCRGVASPRDLLRLAHATAALHVDLSGEYYGYADIPALLSTLKTRPARNPHL
jgi:sugar/nucleoside kinase (ribokinase family)